MSNFWTDFRRRVEEWADRFNITVTEFEGSHGFFARFTGVTDEGDELPLYASWRTHEDARSQPPR